MAARIGFGNAATLRSGARGASRYTMPASFHPGALWLAAAAPLLGLIVLLGAR